jgi:DNA-binding transcriptional LysR family regulator
LVDTLISLQVFCAIAERKSFAAAAEHLGLSPAMASKHIMRLESRLATRLLNRTSRRVSLTESGELYFRQVRQMLDSLDEVEAAVSNVTVTPRGTLRFSAPVWFANPVFARILADYRNRYPDIRFDIDLSGRLVNLVDEGIDLALRVTRLEALAPGLVARPLTEVWFDLVAAPTYLDRTGRPDKIADLNDHALMLYNGIPTSEGTFMLNGPNGPETVRFQVVMESHNETMLHLAALEGMGMTLLPKWMSRADVEGGKLEIVLPDALRFGSTMFAVYPSRKYLSAKVRTFIDFLANDPRLR